MRLIYIVVFYLFLSSVSADAAPKLAELSLGDADTITTFEVTFSPKNDSVKFTCPNYKKEEFNLIFTGKDILASPSLPVTIQSCDSKREKVVLWLRGGPFVERHDEMDAERALYLSLGYTVIEPEYSGSFRRIIKLRNFLLSPIFADDIAALGQLLDNLLRSEIPIVIHGESYGGFIASLLANKMRKTDLLVLQNPMTSSPANSFIDTKTSVFSLNEPSTITYDGKKTAYNDLPEKVKLVLQKNFLSQYYRNYKYSTLIKVIQSKKIICNVRIIFGSEDKIIGIKELRKFKNKYKNIAVLELSNAGHNFSETMDDYLKYKELILQ